MQPLPMVNSTSLFISNCAETCDLYDLCGGSTSAPCGCIWTGERRLKCEKCPIVCRERKSPGFSIERQILEGVDLESVKLNQPTNTRFPLFIPLATDEIESTVDASWVGGDLKFLLAGPKKLAAKPSRRLAEARDVRSSLNAREEAYVVAVLNGLDDRLERFWGMGETRRVQFFKLLQRKGVQAVTGPTFSITDESSGFPASHNVVMQRRHHRVLQEIHDAGLFAIPNLYWRAEYDRQKWVSWLNDNSISVVTLDFSRSKHPSSFAGRLDDLINVLAYVSCRTHVLLVGASLANGLTALKRLQTIGCTGSVVSSHPVRAAISGGEKFELSEGGKVRSVQNLDQDRQTLAHANIEFASWYLRHQLHNTT